MLSLDFGQVFGIFLVLIIILISSWIFFRGSIGMCHSQKDLTGKTTLVTGANCGIGYYTALDFAKRNARVILACRSPEKAEKAKEDIIAQSGNTNVAVGIVDLSSMKSVRKFVYKILQDEERLDILVNNAGVLIPDSGKQKQLSEDGLEMIFAANHFGPFLLTNLLLGLLKSSAPSRIVNVSSMVHRYGAIDFDNLQGEKSFNFQRRYSDSKLANVLFTCELARRLEGTNVTTNALHPGTVASSLLRNLFPPIRVVIQAFIKIFCKSPEEGAQTSIYLAISDEVEDISGKYFSDCAMDEAGVNPVSKDMDLAKKLWEVSAQLTGLESKTS